jgi:hypothetical protein
MVFGVKKHCQRVSSTSQQAQKKTRSRDNGTYKFKEKRNGDSKKRRRPHGDGHGPAGGKRHCPLSATQTTEAVLNLSKLSQSETINRVLLESCMSKNKQDCERVLENINQRRDEIVKILECSNETVKDAHIDKFVTSIVNVDTSATMVKTSDAFAHKIENANVEGVKRCWEEAFMMEPVSPERECVNFGKGTCIATEMFKDVFGSDFTLKEFYLPSEIIKMREDSQNNHASLLNHPKPCILCNRNNALSFVLNVRSSGSSCPVIASASKYHNFIGIPGEYFIDHCICSSVKQYEGLVDPVVLPLKHYFDPVQLNGLRVLRQTVPAPHMPHEVF